MKSKLRKMEWQIMLLFVSMGLFITACSNDDGPVPTAPQITTNPISEIMENTAVAGGVITGDGNADIIGAGIAYSATTNPPTIADNTIQTTTTIGSFSVSMENLQSGSTYYVRAYASNDVGVGYGDVVTFATENGAPEATAVTISGTVEANMEVTAAYTYSDTENDPESGTTFKWYVADNASGSNEIEVTGEASQTLVIPSEYEGKYLAVGVTPSASSGTSPGAEARSDWNSIGDATTITFEYNGEEVTYGIITSAETGRKWLDRNLGAPNAPTAVDDWANYGDVFQWGRLEDGHQLVVRTGPTDEDAELTATTSLTIPYDYSSTDDPGHSLFIAIPNGASPADWRSPSNNDLWQGIDGTNNPCPSGFRMATNDEWDAENLLGVVDSFDKLKITITGLRSINSDMTVSESYGSYWSSSIGFNNTSHSRIVYLANNYYGVFDAARAYGAACRCIKDE